MASLKERVFAGFGAILFFLSSIALTVVVVVQLVQEHNQNKKNAAVTSQVSAGKKLQGTTLKNFTPVSKVDQLQTTDLTVGSGEAVSSTNDTVTADYTGALASTGVIFQSSLDSGQPFTTKLSGVIAGWQQGMIGMKAGGVRRLVIPAALAYGDQAQQGIPANSDLVFDITLHKVQH